jgi:D-methionine transport system substrate-binding protein
MKPMIPSFQKTIKMSKQVIFFALWTAGVLLLNSCGNSSKKDDPNFIKVGITSGPEREIAEAAKKEAKEKYNLEVELVAFNDYVVPNEALSNGDIDINAFQHVPYLEEQSRQRGYKLAVVGYTFVYPIVAYSKKIKNISELQNGSTIVIPNDPTNSGRSLLLLQKNGLLKLKDNVGLLPKVTDIVENPKQLKILEIEAPQLPRVLDDKEVTVAVINNNFAAQAGLDPNEYGVMKEDKKSPYVNVIAAREDNKDLEKVKNFVKAYQSEAVVKAAEKAFKGGAIKGW